MANAVDVEALIAELHQRIIDLEKAVDRIEDLIEDGLI